MCIRDRYKNQYTRLEGEIRGLTEQQKTDKKKSLDQAPASGQIAGNGPGSGSGSRSGVNAMKIGYGVTRPDGTFSADVAIPAAVDLARYEIFLTSEEDAHYNG